MMDVTSSMVSHGNTNNSVSNSGNSEMLQQCDEVDFVAVAAHNNNNNNIFKSHVMNNSQSGNNSNAVESTTNISNSNSKIFANSKTSTNEHLRYQQQPRQQEQQQHKDSSKSKKKSASSSEEPKKKNSAKERLSLFSTLGRRISQKTLGQKDKNADTTNTQSDKTIATESSTATPTTTVATTNPATPPRPRTFAKGSSIVRLLGHTHKKFEKYQQSNEKGKTPLDGKFHTYGGRRRTNGPYLDRFKRYSKDDGDVNSTNTSNDNSNNNDEDADTTMDFTDVLELDADTANELQRDSSGLDRFCDHSTVAAGDDEAAAELGSKTMRTLSRSLGRLWGKRLHSVNISTPDPEYKVSYLGNVLTGWAKGEGCVEKQLNTLWRNYTQNNKPDMIMRIKVCASGIKATTRQHGLTEYWANRITHCCAPKNYPRIFCWVYRHEGRKLKHELRCHAVLCSKEKVVQDICNTLKENLERALREFKREKILKQNARLSLANACYENPSLPRRKILLIVGGSNYRPPLERSKSAPKLMAIEEAIGEEEGEDAEDTNEPEMKACCQKDSLYPAMTLGRRRCRRGHSIRRTGKARPLCGISLDESQRLKQKFAGNIKVVGSCWHSKETTKECANKQKTSAACSVVEEEQRNSFGSDDSDDFEKLLKYNDYDSNASLATELLPYFDMQLHKNTSSSLSDLCVLKDEEEPLSMLPTINSDPMAHPEGDLPPTNFARQEQMEEEDEDTHVGLRRSGVCSDGEEDYLEADDMYFRQATILNMLHRNSMRKMAQLSLSSDEGSSIETNASAPLQYRHQMQSSISSNASSNTTTSSSLQDGHNAATTAAKRHSGADSDEGSISSGCETASTVTANQDDLSLQYRHNKQLLSLQHLQSAMPLDADDTQFFNIPHNAQTPITANEIYQRLEARLERRQNSDATTFSSSSTITLKMGTASGGSTPDNQNDNQKQESIIENEAASLTNSTTRVRRQRQRQLAAAVATPLPPNSHVNDSDSECSDESGYVEYQERDKTVKEKVNEVEQRQIQQQQKQQQQQLQPIAQQRVQKPQLPPKPIPRRSLSSDGNAIVSLVDGHHAGGSTAV